MLFHYNDLILYLKILDKKFSVIRINERNKIANENKAGLCLDVVKIIKNALKLILFATYYFSTRRMYFTS